MMIMLFRRIWFFVAAIWLASAMLEGTHHHTDKVQCILCLCPAPGRRKSELLVPGTEGLQMRAVEAKLARVLDKSLAKASVAEFESHTVGEPPQAEHIAFLALLSERFVSFQAARLQTCVLITGPPRAPPA